MSAGIMKPLATAPKYASATDVVWFGAPWIAAWNAEADRLRPEPIKVGRAEKAKMTRIWNKHMKAAR